MLIHYELLCILLELTMQYDTQFIHFTKYKQINK